MSQSIVISKVTRYQNAALNYYLGLTDSPFLHYGYWDPLPTSKEELTIPRLRAAQEAYAAKLVTFIPEQVKTILDVGCGTGGNAAYLLERGYGVEGLAPDPFQQERFLQSTQGKALFHLTEFEKFTPTQTYDLVLLSESSQYMAATDIAQCAANALEDGGYLLLADMLRSDPSYRDGIFSNCHPVDELQTALQQRGFHLVKSEDISTQVAPTIDLCVENFRRFGLSTGIYLGELLSIAVPPIYKLFKWAYDRWAEKPISEGLEARNIFEKHLCYQIQLWQLSTPEKGSTL